MVKRLSEWHLGTQDEKRLLERCRNGRLIEMDKE